MPSIIQFNASLHTDSICAIGKQIFNASDVSLLEKALQECSQEYSRVYYNDLNNLLGFALVRKRNPQIETYELAFLGVSPAAHGKGIGSKLLTAVDKLQPQGATSWLLVNQDNTLAQNMYSKFGFHILCDCFDSYMVPCYVMIKKSPESPIYNYQSSPESPQPPAIQLC